MDNFATRATTIIENIIDLRKRLIALNHSRVSISKETCERLQKELDETDCTDRPVAEFVMKNYKLLSQIQPGLDKTTVAKLRQEAQFLVNS